MNGRTGVPRVISTLIIASLLLFCGYNIYQSTYHFNGITGTTRKNGSGCVCHDSTATPSVAVWIAGPETLAAGAEGIYSLFVARDTAVAAGFNVATEFGSLEVVDSSETYWYEDELTHAQPKLAGGSDTISWQFRYRPPHSSNALVDTIFSAANVVNLDTNATDADTWNFGDNFLVQIVGSTSVNDPARSRNETAPAKLQLFQNYPNPFNPVTRFEFIIHQSSFVNLSVYDLLGREVAILVNEKKSPGTYEVTWDASGQPSGIYFYRLSTPDYVQTRKLVLLR